MLEMLRQLIMYLQLVQLVGPAHGRSSLLCENTTKLLGMHLSTEYQDHICCLIVGKIMLKSVLTNCSSMSSGMC